MNTIFKHPKLCLKEIPGKGVGVFTTDKLAAETIILVEHAMLGNPCNLDTFMLSQPRLAAALSPRKAIPSDLDEVSALTAEKLMNNCVATEEELRKGEMILGKNFNFFNHSCTPNAHWSVWSQKEPIFKGLCIYLKEDVECDTEVTLSYSIGAGHELEGFKCMCGLSLAQRTKNMQILQKWCSDKDMTNRCSSYIKSYHGTQPEFYNTYRQNMHFDDGALIDLANYVCWGRAPSQAECQRKRERILRKLDGYYPRNVKLEGWKQIQKSLGRPINIDMYIKLLQATFKQIEKDGMDWI